VRALFRKKFCFFNQQLTEADYFTSLAQLKAVPRWEEITRERMRELGRVTPRKYYSGGHNEGSTGDHLASCRNAVDCFDCTFLEDCRFCTWLHRSRDCYDCYAWGLSGELGLENHLVGNNFYNVLFSDECSNNVSDLYYCRGCYNSTHLFGCVGMKNASYCIFNQQYTKSDYEKLLAKIITAMQARGEWGEFFPQWMAPYSYNETVAAEPLPGVYGENVTHWDEVSLDPEHLQPELARRTFACTRTGRNFRYTAHELTIYRKLGISAPQICFEERYRLRRDQRNPRVLFSRHCDQCDCALESTYSPDREENILCEACYQHACA
jgi:hypothetical protein